MIADRFVEVIRHYVLTKTHQLPSVLIASRSRFTALPADVQTAIRESVPAAITEGLAYYNRFREESFVEVRRRGINIVEPDLAPFKAAARPAYETILANAPNGRKGARLRLTRPDGAELAVSITGEGPGLLLVSGLGGTAAFWSKLVPALAPHFRVAVLDQRGVGA
eukprot:gene21529-26372_t